MILEYVSVKRIFANIARYKLDISESDIIEWSGEALEALQAVRSYKEHVAFIEVKNYTCDIPQYLHNIIQIARDRKWKRENSKVDGICPIHIKEEIEKCESEKEEDCKWVKPEETLPVFIDCDGAPITGYEVAYFRPFFDLQWEYPQWNGCDLYRSRYTPIRLSTNTFASDLACQSKCDNGIGFIEGDQYSIDEDAKVLKFNFQEGGIAIAYLKQRLDEDGYPMIPDSEYFTSAINAYVLYKFHEIEFYSHREGSENRLQYAESKWKEYQRRATNIAFMPQSVDEWENLLRQRDYIIPRTNRYQNFFGNLSRTEYKGFMDAGTRRSQRIY